MAYSKVARELRECLGTRKNGEPCRAWAVWDDPRQLCVAHAGRHHTGPMPRVLSRTKPAKYKPCCCPAYNWLHRPGGGLCRWPDVPEYRLTTPQGTKSPARSLLSLGREMRLMRMALEELRFWEEPYPKREPELQHEKSDAHASGELDADDQPSPYEGMEIIQSGYPLAFAAISAITAVLLFLLPADGLNSPYVQWAWRIPFFIGAVLAFVMAAYFYYFVDESELFEASGGTESPLKTLFSGENLKNFLQVFVLMSGFWLSLNTVSAVLPGLLGSQVGLSNTNVTITLVIAYITLALAFVGAGALSQLIGRRTLLMWLGGLMAVVGTFLYYLLISATPESLLMVVLLTTIITVLVSSNWGLATSYINERFHTSVRASGFGIGYSLAVILPSFYAFYQAGLATFMPFEYTVLVLLVIGGLLILGGAAWGPETKDVDF